MDDLAIQGHTQCPDCGADNPPRATYCWLCGVALDRAKSSVREQPIDAELVNQYRPPSLLPPPPPQVAAGTPHQFRLITLFLIVTVAGLCLGLWRIAPGLMILLLIIAVPALIRAQAVSRRMATGGQKPGLTDLLIAFATSFALVILVLVAGIVAFCIACFAALFGIGQGGNPESLLAMGVLGSLVVMVVLFVVAWPRRKRD